MTKTVSQAVTQAVSQVTQAYRDMLADIYALEDMGPMSLQQETSCREGRWDDCQALKILAHHAEQARLEERERCARVVETHGYGGPNDKAYWKAKDSIAEQAATAIRKGEAHD